jgi:DNA mismatch endonuclease (patch repair protein)
MGTRIPYPEPLNEDVSRRMRANRRRDTKPERALRSALHRRGLRFRKDLPIRAGGRLVRPDVVFTRQRVAVFLDGCYWHSCPIHGTSPTRNSSYWDAKLRGNVERDHLVNQALSEAGWEVIRVWEHEHPEEAASLIEGSLVVLSTS